MISILLHLICPVFFYTMAATVLYQSLELEPLTATALSAALTTPFLLYFYRKDQRRRGEKPAFSFRLSGCLAYILLLGAALSLFGNYFVEALHLAERSDAYGEVSMALYSPPLIFQLFFTGLVIPFAEELIFRGLIFASLCDKLPFLLSALLSSVFFGLYHGNLPQGVYAFTVGMAAAWLYKVHKTLLAPFLLHVSANLLSILVTNTLLFNVFSGSGDEKVLFLKAAVFGALSVFCAARIYRKTNLKEEP